jgi:hypothetical protein
MIVRARQSKITASLLGNEGVFSRSDVSEQEPFVAMGRMGVKIINPLEGI